MERPDRTLLKRSKLLFGLVLVAIGPAIAMLVNHRHESGRERDVHASGVAMQRAELLDASLGAVVEGARQTMAALSAVPQVRELDPACTDLLRGLRDGMPPYSVVAVARRDGTPVCAAASAALPSDALAGLIQPFRGVTGFTTGSFTRVAGVGNPLLTFALPFGADVGAPAGLIVAGLDLARLGALLAGAERPADARLVLADRGGRILASVPDAPGDLGRVLEAQDLALLGASGPGTVMRRNPDGSPRVVGYVPPGQGAAGFYVSAGFDVADVAADIDHAADRGYVLIALCAVLTTVLAALAAHRTLRVPASVLLEAAQRWGSGDLTARATMPGGAATDFSTLGRAFNGMAEVLQRQRSELQALNDALEVRVADRTRALLDSNNRLQVEIAERELTEASLRQAQKLQAVGQLAGGMAHEFNNLLTAILGSLELLRRRIPAGEARQERLIDTATSAVERGSRLTAQLLAFSRKQALLAVSVDVADAIRGMAGLLASTLGSAARLETRVNDDLWPAMLDPNQFEAAILNLALNARDAMPSGGRLTLSASNVAITSSSSWPELPHGDYVCVAVSDSGSGMPPEVSSRAFEPFFTTKAPGKGSGLGLSQVHGMVRQSGGSVSIHSRPGEGTKVTMMLPRSLGVPLAGSGGDLDPMVPALGRTEAILLVDDDDQVRDVTETILRESGYTVIAAANGTAALAELGRQGARVALVIADYAMPGMTGRELLQTVRHEWPGVAVLLATGYADYPELTGHELPIDQIIRKPFRSNELLARIHMVVQRQADPEATVSGSEVM